MRWLLSGFMQIWLAAQPAHSGYLTDGAGGFLLDNVGGKILISDNVHNLQFLSTWGTGQSISVWFDVLADKSGVHVWGTGSDNHLSVIKTEIVHVLPNGSFVSLLECPQSICDVIWPREQMTAGQANEILFFITLSDGTRYGASTRISKPQ